MIIRVRSDNNFIISGDKQAERSTEDRENQAKALAYLLYTELPHHVYQEMQKHLEALELGGWEENQELFALWKEDINKCRLDLDEK